MNQIEVKTIPAFPELNKVVINPNMFAINDNYVAVYEPDMDTLNNDNLFMIVTPEGTHRFGVLAPSDVFSS